MMTKVVVEKNLYSSSIGGNKNLSTKTTLWNIQVSLNKGGVDMERQVF